MKPRALLARLCMLSVSLPAVLAAQVVLAQPAQGEGETGTRQDWQAAQRVVFRAPVAPGSSLVTGPAWRDPLPPTLNREYSLWRAHGGAPEQGLAALLPPGLARTAYVPRFDYAAPLAFSPLGLGGQRAMVSLNGADLPLSPVPTRDAGALAHNLSSLLATGTDGVRVWETGLGVALGPGARAGALDIVTAPQRRGFHFSLDRLAGGGGAGYNGSLFTGALSAGSDRHNWLVHFTRRGGDVWTARDANWAADYLNRNPAFGRAPAGARGVLLLPQGAATTYADAELIQVNGYTWPTQPTDPNAAAVRNARALELVRPTQDSGLVDLRPRLFGASCEDGVVARYGGCRASVVPLLHTGAQPDGNRLFAEINHQFGERARLTVTAMGFSDDGDTTGPGRVPLEQLSLWRDDAPGATDAEKLAALRHPVLDRYLPLLPEDFEPPRASDFLVDQDTDTDGVQKANGDPYTDAEQEAATQAVEGSYAPFSLRTLAGLAGSPRDRLDFRALPLGFSRSTLAERRRAMAWKFEGVLGETLRMRTLVQLGSSGARVTRTGIRRARLADALDGYGGTLCTKDAAVANDAARGAYLAPADVDAAFTKAETEVLDPQGGTKDPLLEYYEEQQRLLADGDAANDPAEERRLSKEDLVAVALLHSLDASNARLTTYRAQQSAFRDPDAEDPTSGILTRADLTGQHELYIGRGRNLQTRACLYWDPLAIAATPMEQADPSRLQGKHTQATVGSLARAANVTAWMEGVSILDYDYDTLDAEFTLEGGRGVAFDSNRKLGWVAGARLGTQKFSRLPSALGNLNEAGCDTQGQVRCYGSLYRVPGVVPLSADRTGYDLFGELRYGTADRWDLQVGARLSSRGSVSAPSLLVAGHYNLSPTLRLRAGWSSSAGFPDIPQLRGGEAWEAYAHVLERNLVARTQGDAGLDAETLDRIFLGVELRLGAQDDLALSWEFFDLSLADALVLEPASAWARRLSETLAASRGGGCTGPDSDADGVCDSRKADYDALAPRLGFANAAMRMRDLAGVDVRQRNGPKLALQGWQLGLRWALPTLGPVRLALGLDHRELTSADAGTLWLGAPGQSPELVPGGDVLGRLNAESPFGAQPRRRSRLAFDMQLGAAHRMRLSAHRISQLRDGRTDANLAADLRWNFSYAAKLPNGRATFSFSIENLTDEAPPQAPTPWGFEPSVHSGGGMQLRVGLRHSFGDAN